ncbi:MAG TPA: HAD hydrolase family protein [Thermoanaerobaculia bacterium]|jgi:YrbI family 3-deoxy-D-manno-octulosonate 8-phosphate phosphatase|nr:HAD hydrolase family protein [Thermoanaerobaculia bacterium]
MSKAANIKLIVSDVDGVWTDGRIIYAGEKNELKEFHVRDGLAVKLAQKVGITVALITSRRSSALERRARELGITELQQGAVSKLAETERVAARLGVTLDQVLYAGDDLPDLAPMSRVAISAAPVDAAPEVLQLATWKLAAHGGHGAFRELVERLLRERGDWEAIVKELLVGRTESQSI